MSKPETAAGSVPETPVACVLTLAALAAQSGRWERLIARAMAGRTEAPDGLRITFRPGPGVETELRELVSIENQCCAWATWTVRTESGQLTLDVRATGAGIPALHGMLTG